MSFLHSPRAWKPRKWLFWIHLYAGLAAGLLALVVGLSGAALVFAPEIELAASWPGKPAPNRLPLNTLTARVMRAHPGFRLQDIRFDAGGNANDFHIQTTRGAEASRGPGGDLRLIVDPATGAVLKTVDRKSGVWHWLRELHHNLLAGKAGRLVNGIGAILLFLLCVTGLVIWWPGPRLLRKRLAIQIGAGWKRVNWDLHNSCGFWIAGALAFLSFTALQFAFPRVFEGAVRLAASSPEPPRKPRIAANPQMKVASASIESLRESARIAIPEGRVTQIKFPNHPGEPVEVRVKTRFDGHQEGNSKVFIHPSTAAVLQVQRFDQLSMGNKLLALAKPLHMARFMTPGWTSAALRAFWVLAGIAPGLLFITGFLMWWNRIVSKRLAKQPISAFLPGRRFARVAAVAGLLASTGWLAHAQEATLAGRVLDGSGAPVADAKVTLQTSPERAARSAGDGRFEFLRVAPGIYSLAIEAPGFAPLLVQARTDDAPEYRLSPAPLLQTVEVNAGAFDQIRLEESVFQTGLTRADIATRNNRRLSDVVARMPGVFMTGPPGGDKDVRLRGLDKEFSRTQIDGIVVPDGGEKRELQLNRIPSSTVESVRIIRNPTAEFESDGLAGRVDVQTRPIPEQFLMDARAGYGGRNNSLINDIAQGQLSAGRRLNRRLGFFGAFDYLNDTLPIQRAKLLASRELESESERQRQRSPNFFGDAGLYSERLGDLHLKPVIMNFDTGMSKLRETHNAAGLRTRREEEAEQKSQRTLGLSLNHRYARASGLILDTQAGWFSSGEDKDKWKLAYKVAGDGSYAADKRTLEPESKSDRTWTASSSAALPFQALLWQELKFGASLRNRGRLRDKDRFEISPAGVSKYTGEAKDRYRLSEDYAAAFIQDRLRLTERLSLTPGVRYERVRLLAASARDAAPPRYTNDINPSTHLLYRASTNLSFRAAASRGLARPKFDELAPYENISTTKIVLGNPDLQPARAWSYDAGFDYATRLITISVNGFRKTLRGVIEEVDTGIDRDGRDVCRVANVGNGWTRGLEFEQRLRMPSVAPRWARLFSIWSNQTLLSSNLRAYNGAERPFKEQPRWIANIGTDFNDERFGAALSLMCNFISRRYDYKPGGDVSTFGASASLDAALYQRIRGNWRLFIEGNNLTGRGRVQDENFVNGAANRRTEIYGRTLLAGIQFSF
jgi:uncharacterized iron-regulated membrane protein/outer membrane receptor protein involved in Fe transport